MWGYHESTAWWIIPMAAFWLTAIWLVIWGTRMFTGGHKENLAMVETPLEIAQKRLARGEISKVEFDVLRKWLE